MAPQLLNSLPISPSVNKKDMELQLAARTGKTERIKVLIEEGCDVHFDKDVALRLAALAGQTEAVSMLLDFGADIHAVKDQAISWAAGKGHSETVALLMRRGSTDGDRALSLAASSGNSDTIKILIRGFSYEKSKLSEALISAAHSCSIDAARTLISHGAEPLSVKNELTESCCNSDDPSFVSFLIFECDFEPASFLKKKNVSTATSELCQKIIQAENMSLRVRNANKKTTRKSFSKT